MRIIDKVAVVTGAAGGIGAAVAQRLLEAGARGVLLTDLDATRLDATVRELAAGHGDRVAGRAADAADTTDLRALLGLAEERFGPVDLYFANAGIGGGAGLEASEEEWSRALDVNVLAHVRAAKLLVPGWVERGEGYFFSTASAAGLLTQIGSATYSVSKHAAVAFSEWLSVTYGDQGVRVSCLCPQGVETELLMAGTRSADATERAAARAVLESGDLLQPLDVADQVVAAVAEEPFLVLPHPQVLDFYRHKGSDYDRWLRGMRRYQKAVR
ncbi:SDR family NAD(P)-dependent oxidoreductase [Streptomyces sp. SID5785]|uniref:SDR family oxidoreductase n=1 Tax=Streptomyces sp. SID5785 TaxID=2690309 RepID=UPI00136113B1|nr:SDR family oxidoreductase [Streptomyces sp. SID5785]MZD09608.1 SDR family NAD(P)-dependent oxidoreductase [Streptomyces sp. SID5785]